MDTDLLLNSLTALCQKASAVILSYYGNQEKLQICHKQDTTPLTKADLAAHHLLTDQLPLIIDLPVVSEESQQNQSFDDYWLIDPIDGTKSFINQSDEFCILIARIKNHRPIIGFIYQPIRNKYYFAKQNLGAYVGQNQQIKPIFCKKLNDLPIFTCYHRPSKKMTNFFKQSAPNGYQHIGLASGLKFCLIAEGIADIYPKLSNKTAQWDTAAGDLLLQEAGGFLCDKNGNQLLYGKNNNTQNPPFIAGGNLTIDQKNYFLQNFQQYQFIS